MEVMQTVEQIVALLDKCERPIEIALVIVLSVLARNVKANTAAISPAVSSPVEVSEQKSTKDEAKAEAKRLAVEKTSTQSYIARCEALFYSDKPVDELSEDEKLMIESYARFVEGGRHGV